MKIVLPFTHYDNVMINDRRTKGYVKSIDFCVDENLDVSINTFDLDNYNRVRMNNVKKWLTKKEDEFDFNPKYKIGQEVLYHNPNAYREFLLKKEVISGYHIISISKYNNLIYYKIGDSYVDSYSLYKDVEDFKYRTKPSNNLKKDQRYVFTKYLSQQNKLIAIDVEKLTTIHSKVLSNYNYGDKIRNCNLYTRVDKFYNKMLANIKQLECELI